ncbi:MAG TPA: hypothetical protein VI172_01835 [Candidatus Dormibacteraeota bacterium]
MPERPRYLDPCPDCTHGRVIVAPWMVRPTGVGTGEVADYRCPAGHEWYTSWDYGSTYRSAA